MTDHYLYVFAFSDDVVKVGRTASLTTRMRAHRFAAHARDARLTSGWFSFGLPAERVRADEQALIQFCAERWPRAWGREYFAGADLRQVIDFASDLEERALTADAA